MNQPIRIFALFLLVFVISACSQQPIVTEAHIQGQTMGTSYNVKFVNTLDADVPSLKSQIDTRLEGINTLMSTYDPNSELSRLNNSNGSQPFKVSAETEHVLLEAVRLHELSEGYLDVTVGPLVNMWGFGPDKRPVTIPSDTEISAVRDFVGIEHISIENGLVTKSHKNTYIDLSTIAKGYGVDAIAELVEKQGIENYLVEIGGEMRVKGNKASGTAWKIAIEKPVSKERAIQRIVSIGDNAIATSGDYRNYYEENGVRYSHLIDPITGAPITHNLVAVTVIHPSSMTADGVATALNVMGKDKAIHIAEKYNLAVLLITRENGEFKEYTSPRFSDLVTVIK
ncbi:FAD:protein FMN transferase [Aestuariibacter sp. AA17]|uniref:FAD:protein FMN transferase n=1 Tax=Fluctibacter corallii TaxID=2984329 RepID=A0ABT3A4Z3_9ALTE|nr:FAD:protein FMN transferase [Aestuariibacter sp. AA17]MCV2883614.1 FAD:protein FMN transferase [Aestuariibacter sp. AA17]